MKKLFYTVVAFTLLLASCKLEESPKATISDDVVFGTENGLEIYSYSFYNQLPDGGNAYKMDEMADYGAVNNLNSFLKEGGYSPETSSGWSWGDLRNINHFIASNTNEAIPEEVRNHYNGLARFFRAYFYYNKVVRFGDVPWVDKPLGVNDEEILYGKRDSRELVMKKIMEDLDYAYNNITKSTSDGSEVTKWVALGLKTRVALFEASFRKYHTELGLQSSANEYYQYAVDAAEEIMTKSPHALYTGQGVELSQRQLFTSVNPVTSEVMLAVMFSEELAVMGSANWWWTSPTYGPRYSLVRPFINTFLQLDGTPYTDRADYMTETFYEETQGRDYRLAQLIRTPGYTRDGKTEAPNFNGYSYTGYQPIKYTLDESRYDNGSLNTNAIPLMRYAEILLNYAEAKAELGTLTDAEWAKSIGALRSRSGITQGINTKPVQVDAYLQKTFFPEISDPVILEVRRERQTELALEGFRFNDLLRWKKGNLLADLPWTGIYVPALNTLMDLDMDGKPDVVFYDGSESGPSIGVPSGVAKIALGGSSTNYQTLTSDNHLEWFKSQKRTWYSDDRQYYYPIPANAIVKNGNLEQNPGWK